MSINNVGNKINIEALHAGVEKKNLKTDEERLIFEALDTDKNGVLDNTELGEFLTAANTDNDGVIKKKEAKKFIKNNAILKEHKLGKEALLTFLQNISENAEDVESVVEIGEGDTKQIKIVYKNNMEKIINADQSYQTHAVSDEQEVIEEYTSEDVRTSQTTISNDKKLTIVTEFESDGTTPAIITEKDEEQHTLSTTKFEEGKKIQNVTKNSTNNSVVTTDYLEDKPVQKTVVKGEVTEISTFNEEGQEFLTQKKENLGEGNVRTTNYTYYEHGKKVETTEPNGDVTATVFNGSGKKLAQVKRIGDNEYSVEYDGSGNTKGIVIQSKEDLNSLAKKYGCTVEQLKALNEGKLFKPGDVITVPGEIDANDEKYINQKTPEQVKEEVRIEAEQRAAQRQQEAKLKKQLAPFGVVDLANNGKKVGKYTIMGNGMFGTTVAIDDKSHVVILDKKTGKPVNLNTHCNKVAYAKGKKVKLSTGQSVVITGVRNDGHGRRLAVDASGKLHVVSWNNQSLRDEYVSDSDDADYGRVRIAYHTRNLPDGQRIGVGKHGYAFKGVHSPEYDSQGRPIRHVNGGSVNANAVINAEVSAIRTDLGDCSDKNVVHSVVTQITDPKVVKGLTNAYGTDFCSKLETELGEQIGLRETAVLVRNGAIDDQSRRNDIIKRNITTFGDDIENLTAGYSAIVTKEDREAATIAAREYNRAQGYTAPYLGLSELDVLTYGQTDGEAFAVRKANTALFKDETGHNKRILVTAEDGSQKYVNLFARDEQITSRAAEASYFLNDADINGALAIADGEILERADALRAAKGEQSIHDLTINDVNDMVKVIETGYIPYDDTEIVTKALKTVIGSFKGDRQGTYARHYQETLKNLLRTSGSANMFIKILNNDPNYANVLANQGIDADELGKYVRSKIGFNYTHPNSYSLIASEASDLTQYYTPEELEEYHNQYDYLKDAVDRLQQGWDGIVDDEGAIDAFLNEVRTIGFGGYKPEIGVVRRDVNSVLKNARRELNDLGLAANFRLYNGDGSEVSFEQQVKALNLNELGTSVQGLQSKYQEHQAYANAGLDIALCFVGPGGALKGIGTITKLTKAAKGVNVVTKVVNAGRGVAAVMDASAIGRVTMALGEAVGTGVAVGGGTFAALEIKNEANYLTSTTGGSAARREQDFENALKMAEISGFSAVGGHLLGSGLVGSLKHVENAVARGGLTGTAIAGQVGVDYAAMKAVYGEDMRPVDFALSLVGGAFGNVMALRSVKGRTGKVPEPASSTLAEVTKHQPRKGAEIEIAQPAAVVLKNEQKINKIISEVTQNAPTLDGAGLAQTERQIAALSNRDLRRQLTAEIEKAKANLSPEQLDAYKLEQYAIKSEDVTHILQRGNGLKDADLPVIENFVENTVSLSALDDLRQGLRNVQYNGGGCTSEQFARLNNAINKRITKMLNEISDVEVLKQYKSALNEKNSQILNGNNQGYNKVLRDDVNKLAGVIDDRIAVLERSSSAELLGQHVNEMLDAKKLANKGLAPEDVAMISEYIPSITSETELAALRQNVFERGMTTQNKKVLREAFDKKAAELKANADVETPTPVRANDETPTPAAEHPLDETPAVERPAEEPPAAEHSLEETPAVEHPADETPAVEHSAEIDPIEKFGEEVRAYNNDQLLEEYNKLNKEWQLRNNKYTPEEQAVLRDKLRTMKAELKNRPELDVELDEFGYAAKKPAEVETPASEALHEDPHVNEIIADDEVIIARKGNPADEVPPAVDVRAVDEVPPVALAEEAAVVKPREFDAKWTSGKFKTAEQNGQISLAKLLNDGEVSIPKTKDTRMILNDDGSVTIKLTSGVDSGLETGQGSFRVYNKKTGKCQEYHINGEYKLKLESGDTVVFYDRGTLGHLVEAIEIPEGGLKKLNATEYLGEDMATAHSSAEVNTEDGLKIVNKESLEQKRARVVEFLSKHPELSEEFLDYGVIRISDENLKLCELVLSNKRLYSNSKLRYISANSFTSEIEAMQNAILKIMNNPTLIKNQKIVNNLHNIITVPNTSEYKNLERYLDDIIAKDISILEIHNRNLSEMHNLSNACQKYPEVAAELKILAESNFNIKLGRDINGNLSSNIDNLAQCLIKNPTLKSEIMEYASVSRFANNSLRDCSDIDRYVELLKSGNKSYVVSMAKNPKLGINEIEELLALYKPGTSEFNDVMIFVEKGYNADAIKHNMQRISDPKVREIVMSEAPRYDLIDSTPTETAKDILHKRNSIYSEISSIVPEELKSLRKTLGDEFFANVKWEEIVTKHMTADELKNVINEINNEAKFFARLSINERKYGKNIKWAFEMQKISKLVQKQMLEGASFEEIMSSISTDYHNYDLASMHTPSDRTQSGVLRTNGVLRTPFDRTGGYSEYFDRFQEVDILEGTKRIPNCYNENIKLTRIAYNTMLHADAESAKAAMSFVNGYYSEHISPLIKKVATGEKLTPAEISHVDDVMSEMYFILGNNAPYERGSNGICDIFMRSTYRTLGIEKPALKQGVSLDLEAFCLPLDEYKAKWNSFFEN